MIGINSWLESPATIYDQIRDGRAIAGGMSGSLTAAGSPGGQKRKGETLTGAGGISYMVSNTSIRRA